MQIAITGRGVKLTDAIESYVEKKFNGLEKFFKGIVSVHVILGMETHHHVKGDVFFAEGKIDVPGYKVFAKKTASSLYEAVDILHNYLAAELKKQKAKMRGNQKRQKAGRRTNKEYSGE